MASTLETKSYDRWDRQKAPAKQSQFLDCGLGTDLRRNAWPAACCFRARAFPGAERAKQSQFGESGADSGASHERRQNKLGFPRFFCIDIYYGV